MLAITELTEFAAQVELPAGAVLKCQGARRALCASRAQPERGTTPCTSPGSTPVQAMAEKKIVLWMPCLPFRLSHPHCDKYCGVIDLGN